jgi:hypothetical protein
MLKYAFGFDPFDHMANLKSSFRRKEVIKMGTKKNPCGCGCIETKPSNSKATKKKETKKSK